MEGNEISNDKAAQDYPINTPIDPADTQETTENPLQMKNTSGMLQHKTEFSSTKASIIYFFATGLFNKHE